jgi:uncharacterized membrane protein YqjE
MVMGEVSVSRGSNESQDGSGLRSLGNLFGEVSRELGALVKHEVELAKTQLREERTTDDRADARLGMAVAAGAFGLLFLSLAVVWVLAEIMPTALALLLVALAYGGAAGFLVWRDRQETSTGAGEEKVSRHRAGATPRRHRLRLSTSADRSRWLVL